MKRAVTAALLAFASIPLASCADDHMGVGVAYGGGPYAYDGWYDGYYGPIYDGYWGDDDYFYYRHSAGDHAYVRGDRAHFLHQPPQGPHNYQQLHTTMTPSRGMSMPHFSGGGGHDRH